MAVIWIGLIAGGLYLLQLLIYKRLWGRHLEVDAVFREESVFQGEHAHLIETVENRKRLPLPVLKVKFQCSKYLRFLDDTNSAVTDRYYRNDIFNVLPYRRIIRSHEILCIRRGYYTIHGIDLVGSDLFLTLEMVRGRGCHTCLYVKPAPLPAKDMLAVLMRLNGETVVKRHSVPDPFTYRGIREYTSFDEMRSINWKASSRSEELKVNMRESTSAYSVSIYLNLDENHVFCSQELRELVISLGYFSMDYFLGQQVHVRLYSNAKDILSGNILELEEGRDSGYLEYAGRALARQDFDEGTEAFCRCFQERIAGEEKEHFLIFISADSRAEFQELLTSCLGERDFLWICPSEKSIDLKLVEQLKRNIHMIFLNDMERNSL